MNVASRNNFNERKISFPLGQFLILILMFIVFWGTLFYLKPQRQVGLSFRYDLTSISLFIFLCTSLIFLVKGLWGNILFSFFFIILSALPLSGLWSSGQTEPYTLFGLFPLSDARNYYESALRFLLGGQLSGIASYRPITPAFIALLLRITGSNLQAALAIQTYIVSISAIGATLAIRKRWGNIASAFFTLLIFLFWRPFIGTFLSENLGLAFGLSALYALLGWAGELDRIHLFITGFLLTTALNIRAGAFLILPAIFIVLLLNRNQLPKNSVIIFFSSIVFAFIFNLFVSIMYSNQVVGFSSNVMMNLYQLVTNSDSWREFGRANPNANVKDTWDSIKLIYSSFINEPINLLRALSRAYQEYFSPGRSGLYGFIEGERVHTTRPSVLIGTLVLYAFSILGFFIEYRRWKKQKNIFSVILIASTIGAILSAPILYSGNYSGMRFFAASMPLQLIFPSLGLKFIFENFLKLQKFQVQEKISYKKENFSIFPHLFIWIILLGIAVNVINRSEPQSDHISCSQNEFPLLFFISDGNQISIVKDGSEFPEYLPYINEYRARNSSHGLATTFSSEYKTLQAPFAMVSGIDTLSKRGLFLILLQSEIPEKSGWLSVCVKEGGFPRLDGDGFVFTRLAYTSAIK